MPAGLAIHRLSARIPARAQPVAARLALQALGADLEDAMPRGLPPQALLWLRRLSLQVPAAALAHPAPAAWRADWIAAGRDRMDAALAHAARPALGPVAEDVEAVLFADAAEMLACLALAARWGQLDRWWWRGLLGRSWPQWQTAWAARPEARGAAQRLLVRAGQGRVVAFEDVGIGDVAEARTEAVVEEKASTRESLGSAEAHTDEALRQQAVVDSPVVNAAPVQGDPAKPLLKAVDEGIVLDQAEVSTARAMGVAHAELARPAWPDAVEAALTAPKALRLRAEVLAPEERPAPATPQALALRTRPEVAPLPMADEATAAQAEAPPDVGKTVADLPEPAATVHEPVMAKPAAVRAAEATPELSPSVAPSTPAEPHAAASQQARPREPDVTTVVSPISAATPQAAETPWPWPQALLSHHAPLLFIVNALLEDGLYPDFTSPRDPGLPVPLWALLLALSQAWGLPQGDALQAVLAERAGEWQMPENLPAAPGVDAGPWADWLPAYATSLRDRLCERLGMEPTDWPQALTLERPARLWLSEAEWVIDFELASHDVAWRLAGLDRDPGWLPSVDCTLRFRFSC